MILILNTGSSSLKYKLFNDSLSEISSNNIAVKNRHYSNAVSRIIKEIGNKAQISTIGHRVVHGGNKADEIMPIDLETMNIINEYSSLAPLHNPPASDVIKITIENFPFAKHFAAFDNAFFTNIPTVAKTYPINQDIADKYSIVRYGFHGFSHQSMMEYADPDKNKKIITIHLGAGSSMAAISNGNPKDTSMGFTPLEGLPMQTRSGNIDPGIVLFLIEQVGLKETKNIIENRSGMSGLSGTSGDMLQLLEKDDEKSKLAIDILCYQTRKYLGSYIAVLGGVDSVIFSGQIGYGSEYIRKKILSGFDFIDFKTEKIKPDEEFFIAKKIQS